MEANRVDSLRSIWKKHEKRFNIQAIKSPKSGLTSHPTDINKTFKAFFEKLYTSETQPNIDQLNSFFDQLNLTKFSKEEDDSLDQRSSTLFLGTHYPVQFSYNPNQAHLKRPIKLLKTAWKLQVCWSRLEINFPGEWVPRSRVEDLWSRLWNYTGRTT